MNNPKFLYAVYYNGMITMPIHFTRREAAADLLSRPARYHTDVRDYKVICFKREVRP